MAQQNKDKELKKQIIFDMFIWIRVDMVCFV